MKPKRPTDEQVMLIAKAGLMARDWLVLWTSESQMCLVHRSNGRSSTYQWGGYAAGEGPGAGP